MKYLIVVLLCILFASCSQEELQKQNETAFIDLIKNQIEINDEMSRDFFTRVKRNQKKDDENIYKQALNIQIARKKVVKQFFLNDLENIDSTLIKQYETTLKTPPKLDYAQDSLNHYVNLISQNIEKIKYRDTQQSKTQKIVWVSQLLGIEANLLDYYKSQMSYAFGIRDGDAFSDDKPQVGELYEIFIASISPYEEGVDYSGKHYTIIRSFTFQIDGVEIKIAYKIERIEDSGILRFTLPKKGKYAIWGSFRAQYDHDEQLIGLHSISHSFEVK